MTATYIKVLWLLFCCAMNIWIIYGLVKAGR